MNIVDSDASGSPTSLPLVLRLPPLTHALQLFPGLLIICLAVFGDSPMWGAWLFVVLLPIALVLRLRQRLVVDDTGVTVTILRTRRIPWADVQGFSRGSGWMGGTNVLTAAGSVRSVAPCSWWGGRPSADQIALLEDIRVRQRAAPGQSDRSA